MPTYYQTTSADKASVLYDYKTIDTSKDIVISFDYNCSGAGLSGLDGFSLFFTESISSPRGGAVGPGLGVTSLSALSNVNCSPSPFPPFDIICIGTPVTYGGAENSVLAIGFDISGRFGSGNYYGLTGPNEEIPNTITLRSGKAQNYEFLYKTPPLHTSAFEEPFYLYSTQTTGYNTFRARLTNLGKTIILDHKIGEGKYNNILRQNISYTLPQYIYGCIGFSTNIDTDTINLRVKNFHENGFFVTPTVTPSYTPTVTPTPTITPTKTVTPSITPSNTVTPSITPSNTVTPSITPSNTVTPSITPSNTVTPSITPSNTATPSITPSNTPTNSETPTNTPTPTETPTVTPSVTVTATPSVTPTNTVTPSVTPTNTVTPTVTPSVTPTNTVTPSITPTNTRTPTVTPSVTPSATNINYLMFPSNQTNIIINDNAVATPYPVEFTVSGITRIVEKVTIKLLDYNHSFTGDVAMLLVAPNGISTIIAGRVGEDSAINVNVMLDQDASQPWSGYTSGTFKPNSTTDDFPFDNINGCPVGPYNTSLDAFFYMSPGDANGTWKLYIQDFAPVDSGTLQSAQLYLYQVSPFASPTPTASPTKTPTLTPTNTPTFPLPSNSATPTVTPSPTTTPSITVTQSNIDYVSFASATTNLVINDESIATPYPLNFNVSGLAGTFSKVTVQLSGYYHDFTEDVVMLLVSPNNTTCLLAGRIGLNSAIDTYVTLDQYAGTPWDGFSSGYFRTNSTSNTFAMSSNNSCPSGPYNTSLSVYNNINSANANGTWKLYIQDFAFSDTGSLYNATLRFHN